MKLISALTKLPHFKHGVLTIKLGQESDQPLSQDHNIADAYTSPHEHVTALSPSMGQWEDTPPLDMDFLASDFLDQWQLDFSN